MPNPSTLRCGKQRSPDAEGGRWCLPAAVEVAVGAPTTGGDDRARGPRPLPGSTRDTRHPTPDTRHATRDTPHATRHTRHPTRDTQHATPNTRHATPDTRHAKPDTRHPTPDTPDATFHRIFRRTRPGRAARCGRSFRCRGWVWSPAGERAGCCGAPKGRRFGGRR